MLTTIFSKTIRAAQVCAILLLLSSCKSFERDYGLPSPCVGTDDSPCVRRPANNNLLA